MHRSSLVTVRGIARKEASPWVLKGLSLQQWTPLVVTIATLASASGRFNGVQGISSDGIILSSRNCKIPGTWPVQRAMRSPSSLSLAQRTRNSRRRFVESVIRTFLFTWVGAYLRESRRNQHTLHSIDGLVRNLPDSLAIQLFPVGQQPVVAGLIKRLYPAEDQLA